MVLLRVSIRFDCNFFLLYEWYRKSFFSINSFESKLFLKCINVEASSYSYFRIFRSIRFENFFQGVAVVLVELDLVWRGEFSSIRAEAFHVSLSVFLLFIFEFLIRFENFFQGRWY